MKTYVLEPGRNITAFPRRKAAIASGDPIFSTVEEMTEVFRVAQYGCPRSGHLLD